jgi:uncharacterized OB-fold protein
MSELPPPRPAKWIERGLHPAAREYYRRLREERRLATTRCEPCGRTEFPPRERCPACGADETWVELPLEGRLHAFTTQETAIRFAAPAVLALAELGDVVVPGIAEAGYDELSIGQRVRVELRDEPQTGMTLLGFRPAPRS